MSTPMPIHRNQRNRAAFAGQLGRVAAFAAALLIRTGVFKHIPW